MLRLLIIFLGFGLVAKCTAQEIIASYESGFYPRAINLKIHSSDSTCKVTYTLDGSEPRHLSKVFPDGLRIEENFGSDVRISCIPTTAIPNTVDEFGNYYSWQSPDIIRQCAVIKVACFNGELKTTDTRTFTFLVGDQFAELTFPVVSIVVDPKTLFDPDTGIYVPGNIVDPDRAVWTGNYQLGGREMERRANFHYFENHQLIIDQNVGVRVHGMLTAAAPQKGLRLYARKEYGETWIDHPFFPDTSFRKFKRLILRTPYSCDELFYTDPFVQAAASSLNLEIMMSTPSVVFLNGEYWGVHNVRERMDKWYLKSRYPELDVDQIDIINRRGNVREGSDVEFKDLMEFIESNSLADSVNYAWFDSTFDIASFIDYMIVETFFDNRDWGVNNVKFWKQRGKGKWRLLLIDCDKVMGEPNSDLLQRFRRNRYELTLIMDALMLNPFFKSAYYSRFEELSKTVLSPTVLLHKLDSFDRLYMPEIEWHRERWHYPRSSTAYQTQLELTQTFIKERHHHYLNNFMSVFDPSYVEPEPVNAQDEETTVWVGFWFILIGLLLGLALVAAKMRQ